MPKTGTIVDMHCGDGLICCILARKALGRQVIGFDSDPRRLTIARRAGRLLDNLQFASPPWHPDPTVRVEGVILAPPAPAHVPSPELLGAIAAMLCPGGVLVLRYKRPMPDTLSASLDGLGLSLRHDCVSELPENVRVFTKRVI